MLSLNATNTCILCTVDLAAPPPALMDVLTAVHPDPAPFYMLCGASLRKQKYKWFACSWSAYRDSLIAEGGSLRSKPKETGNPALEHPPQSLRSSDVFQQRAYAYALPALGHYPRLDDINGAGYCRGRHTC